MSNPRRPLMLALYMARAEALELIDLAACGRYVEPDELDAATMVADWTSTETHKPEFA